MATALSLSLGAPFFCHARNASHLPEGAASPCFRLCLLECRPCSSDAILNFLRTSRTESVPASWPARHLAWAKHVYHGTLYLQPFTLECFTLGQE